MERFSDLAVIAMHHSERFEVDEIFEAFVTAHPIRVFQASLFDEIGRYKRDKQLSLLH